MKVGDLAIERGNAHLHLVLAVKLHGSPVGNIRLMRVADGKTSLAWEYDLKEVVNESR